MTSDELLAISNGQRIKTIISDTAEVKGEWKLIHIIVATVFTVLEDTLLSADGAGSYAGITFPVGAVIGGNFTNIKLASGTIIAYS